MSQVHTIDITEAQTITAPNGELKSYNRRILREGVDYAKGTPAGSFIPGDTPLTWQNIYELSHEALKGALNPVEFKLANVLNRVIGNRMGNPWAGDTSRIRRQAQARIALLAKTRSRNRDVVVAMLRAGYDVRNIADTTGLHASTVRRWNRRVKLSLT